MGRQSVVEVIRDIHRRSERGRCTSCRGPFEECLSIRAADEIEALRRRDAATVAHRVLSPEILGESMHTALRKTDVDGSHAVWLAIRAMPAPAWHRVMGWVAEALLEYVEREAGRLAS